jgi:hypothetical protein
LSLESPIFVLSSLDARSRIFIECSYRRPIFPNHLNRNRGESAFPPPTPLSTSHRLPFASLLSPVPPLAAN